MNEYELQLFETLLGYAEACRDGQVHIPPYANMLAARTLIEQYQKRRLHDNKQQREGHDNRPHREGGET